MFLIGYLPADVPTVPKAHWCSRYSIVGERDATKSRGEVLRSLLLNTHSKMLASYSADRQLKLFSIIHAWDIGKELVNNVASPGEWHINFEGTLHDTSYTPEKDTGLVVHEATLHQTRRRQVKGSSTLHHTSCRPMTLYSPS